MEQPIDITKLTPEQLNQLRKALALKKMQPQQDAMGLLNQQQLQSIAGMGDIRGDSNELTRQMDISEQLRNKVTGIQHGGIGGNIGRAGYGIASAMRDYKADTLAEALRKKRLSVNPMAGLGYGGDEE